MSDTIAILRWALPILMAILGAGYAFLQHIVLEGKGMSPDVVREVMFLGLTGPLLAWLTLAWALDAARSREAAENELAQRNRQLAALNTVGGAVGRSLEPDKVLNGALERVSEVMALEAGEIRVLEGEKLAIYSHYGVSLEFIEQERGIELCQCLCGSAAHNGQLLIVENVPQDRRLDGQPCAIHGFHSIACVPARCRERVVGLIHLASRTPRVFSTEDRELLVAIGNQIGLAIENTRLYSEIKALNEELEARVVERTSQLEKARQELAHKAGQLQQLLTDTVHIQERERARIAHDMHDGVIQLVVGALYEIQTARQSFTDDHDGLERLETSLELIQQVEAEIRRAVYDLRPPILDAKGLVPALREYAGRFQSIAGMPCTFHVSGTPRRLAPEAEIAIYRIVQEALHNVQSHANASTAEILVRFGPPGLWLMVQDDGQGFDPDSAPTTAGDHMGLLGMRERAQSIDAELDIQSTPGEGTCIVLRAPAKPVAPG
ncbi:MAG: GAF domain-containing protein [Anaerolineae bacterium]